MNEFVGLLGEPELMRNSLILTGIALRTFSTATSVCGLKPAEPVHVALPRRSPLKATGPEVTLKAALTLAPGATGSAKDFTDSFEPVRPAVHCFEGRTRLR